MSDILTPEVKISLHIEYLTLTLSVFDPQLHFPGDIYNSR